MVSVMLYHCILFLSCVLRVCELFGETVCIQLFLPYVMFLYVGSYLLI